jgi:hypothetical protein
MMGAKGQWPSEALRGTQRHSRGTQEALKRAIKSLSRGNQEAIQRHSEALKMHSEALREQPEAFSEALSGIQRPFCARQRTSTAWVPVRIVRLDERLRRLAHTHRELWKRRRWRRARGSKPSSSAGRLANAL